MESDSLQHGDLRITTHRRPDGTLVVRIQPGREAIEVHQYPREAAPTRR